jgi:hypothetical protein
VKTSRDAVSMTRRACYLGSGSSGGGAAGCWEEKVKIKASIMNTLKWTRRRTKWAGCLGFGLTTRTTATRWMASRKLVASYLLFGPYC